MVARVSSRVSSLRGRICVPGDKSISHRALMLGAMAVGEMRISDLLDSADVHATRAALEAMGVETGQAAPAAVSVYGVGSGGLAPPDDILDLGNSGTSARLLMGLLASHPFTALLTGDASLRRRPMARVIEPLSRIGARITATEGGRLPLAIAGSDDPLPLDYAPLVASAQVKSAILLAGLNTPGHTIVREAVATRDHTERLLAAMGAGVTVEDDGRGGRVVTLAGEAELRPVDITVPGDISSAAFPLVAALITGESDIVVRGVGINPLRTGLLDALEAMGAQVSLFRQREAGGEPVADIKVSAPGGLAGLDLEPAQASRMIDEFPVLFVAAAYAKGKSRFTGLGELRVKESDRIATMAVGLAACGVALEELPDGLVIHGRGRPPNGGATVATRLDHRVAMAFLVLGMATEQPVAIDDDSPIATSFPGFVELMNGLGASITAA